MATITPIHPATHMGAVSLIVTDLNRSVHYYQASIGLHMQEHTGAQARLGVGNRTLLILTEQKGARPVQRGRTGLYHFALLLPNRKELARTLRHLIDTQTPLQGMSDHGVSEAIYLGDPDGHGIEIYRDRPRAEWPIHDNTLQMTLDPINVPDLLGEVTSGRITWHGMHTDTIMGHVHLHVASLQQAEQFYCNVLGFGFMQRMFSQASFVSAGGYHHHLGLNIWAGQGAPPAPPDAARLDCYEIILPNSDAYSALLTRVHTAGIPLEEADGRARLQDPSFNTLVLINGERAARPSNA